MPLAFSSKSHGTVAFGFFNIEMDMLLLQDLFFHADRFCSAVVELSSSETKTSMKGWRIEPGKTGDLHGAIAGIHLAGFIGETYVRFPFPKRPEGFKQNPEPAMSRDEGEALASKYGEPLTIPLVRSPEAGTFSLGNYVFTGGGFSALVDYVDRGGYPRWKDEVRPAYVREMMEVVKNAPWLARQETTGSQGSRSNDTE
ncbi:MAG: hypothetical protein ACYTFG_08535 [Planctomycetota bacterium]|jgi:hypothetical protein